MDLPTARVRSEVKDGEPLTKTHCPVGRKVKNMKSTNPTVTAAEAAVNNNTSNLDATAKSTTPPSPEPQPAPAPEPQEAAVPQKVGDSPTSKEDPKSLEKQEAKTTEKQEAKSQEKPWTLGMRIGGKKKPSIDLSGEQIAEVEDIAAVTTENSSDAPAIKLTLIIEATGADGRKPRISATYDPSLKGNSRLGKFVKFALGRSLTAQEEEDGFDPSELKGRKVGVYLKQCTSGKDAVTYRIADVKKPKADSDRDNPPDPARAEATN